ncbi:hypothetical protein V9K67_25755 [Paraflavisolibacter sp. H34]|uniref:hypothetical protein n=1 Tax=Huijunlia imazamoxiresistens TaxID=3127457 RepID=UPI0030167239
MYLLQATYTRDWITPILSTLLPLLIIALFLALLGYTVSKISKWVTPGKQKRIPQTKAPEKDK